CPQVWRVRQDGGLGGQDRDRGMGLGGAGDVIAAGVVFDGAGYVCRVVKLAGATGAELWHVDGAGEEPLALAVDAANDVIFSYGVDIDLVGTIAKLSGADGSVLWTHGPQAPGIAAIAVDAAGDVITADGRGTQVAKRSGADGSIVWTQPPA